MCLGKGVRMKQQRRLGKAAGGEKKTENGMAYDPSERSRPSSHLVDGVEGH